MSETERTPEELVQLLKAVPREKREAYRKAQDELVERKAAAFDQLEAWMGKCDWPKIYVSHDETGVRILGASNNYPHATLLAAVEARAADARGDEVSDTESVRIVRDLLMILGNGFVPTIESLSRVGWTHPALPGWIETTESASALCRAEARQTPVSKDREEGSRG